MLGQTETQREKEREAREHLGLDEPREADEKPAQERDEQGRFRGGGASEEAPEGPADDAQPVADEAPPAAEEAQPDPAPEDGAPEPRKYAGRFESVEDLERAYQEALNLAGRHGQELGTLRQRAEQAEAQQREREQRQHQEQQQDEAAKERRAWQELAYTPYNRLTEEQQQFLDRFADEQYGTDGQLGQVHLRQYLLELGQREQQQAQQEREAAEYQERRINYLGDRLGAWIERQPDREALGPEILQAIQQRKHLFNVPHGTPPKEEAQHYEQVFSDLFELVRGKRKAEESARQAAIIADKRRQQDSALNGRHRAAGEAASSPSPGARLPSAPARSKDPVDEYLERSGKSKTLRGLRGG